MQSKEQGDTAGFKNQHSDWRRCARPLASLKHWGAIFLMLCRFKLALILW
jgi:hypothetical protein